MRGGSSTGRVQRSAILVAEGIPPRYTCTVAHTIEPAASGRAKCRGCGHAIAKGELRLGARLPNPFDEEKELTLWFHLLCGAYKRPAEFLEAASDTKEETVNRAHLDRAARYGLEHRRLPRLSGAERAPTGRSTCKSCREPIKKGAWRISIVFYDDVEGRFSPAGSIHAGCAKEYFGTSDVFPRLEHFAPTLSDNEHEELRSELTG